MTKRDFYVRTIEIVKQSLSDIQKADRELASLIKRRDSGDHSPDTAERIKALKMKVAELRSEGKMSVESLCSSYERELTEADSIKGSELTDDARLLSLGMLDKRDLETMLKRNDNNRTMTQLICRYAKKNDIDLGVQYVGNDDIITSLKSFPYMTETVLKWSNNPSVYNQLMGEGSDLEAWSQN